MYNFENRIARLEKNIPKDLIIVCQTNDGEQVKLTVEEFKTCNDLDFIRIYSGNNLDQFDELLDTIMPGTVI